MTDKTIYRKIFFSAAAYTGLKGFFALATTVCTILLIRALSPYEFGKFSLVSHLAMMSGLILSFGSSGTLAKFMPEYKEERSKARLASQALEISALGTLIFFALLALVLRLYPQFIPSEIKKVGPAFPLFILSIALFNVVQGIFRGTGRFLAWSALEGSAEIAARLLAIAFIFLLAKTFYSAFWAFSLSFAVFVLISLVQIRPLLDWHDLAIPKTVLRYGTLLFLGQIVFMLITSVDPILLRLLLKDPAQVGFYFAGIKIPRMLESLMLAPMAVPFVYYFSHPDTLHTRETIITFGTKMLGISCGLTALTLFAAAQDIVTLALGPGYAESVIVLRIYSALLFFVGLQSLSGSFFLAINKPQISIALGFCGFAIIALLDFLLIPTWKAAGAASATVIGSFIVTLAITAQLWRHGIKIARESLLLCLGLMLSMAVGYLTSFYYLAPISFALYVVLVGLLKEHDLAKIQKLWNKQNDYEQPAQDSPIL